MTLPNDISRCLGHALDVTEEICSRRDTCLRYTAPRPDPAWYLHPQIPGPCIYHLAGDTLGRAEE